MSLDRVVIKVKKGEEDMMLALYNALGYYQISSSMQADKTLISFERDPRMKGYKICKKREKEYKKIKKPFPIGSMICLLLGIGGIIASIYIKNSIAQIAFAIIGGLLLAAFLFLLLSFFIMKGNKKALIMDIIQGQQANKPVLQTYQEIPNSK